MGPRLTVPVPGAEAEVAAVIKRGPFEMNGMRAVTRTGSAVVGPPRASGNNQLAALA